MKMSLFILVCLPLLAFAESDVYRCIDDKGETYYSDKECEGGKKIILPPAQTYTPSPSQRKFTYTPPETKADQTKYESVEITTPVHDTTIRENIGDVTVSVGVSPALRTGLGHKLQLYLDGQPFGEAGTNTSFSLKNLDRGTHSLKPAIVDSSGVVLVEGASSIFHVQRFSKIFHEQRLKKKKEAQNPPPPN